MTGAVKVEDHSFDLPPEEFIYVGMDVGDMVRLVGTPQQKVSAPAGETWYYEFGVVMVEHGRVKYKYPPSSRGESVAERSEGLESNAGSGERTTGD